jgi:outer membrane biogenesis lipoprotein LolB
MSRRQQSLVVLTIASLVLTACGTSPTAPRQDASVKAGAAHLDTAPDTPPTLGTTGSGG